MSSVGSSSHAYQMLPGVQQLVETGAVQSPSQQALDSEEANRVFVQTTKQAHGVATAEERAVVEADLAKNQQLVGAMSTLNMQPNVDGVSRVMVAARIAPASFTQMLGATRTAALTMGKSEGANREMGDAMANFALNSGMRATDMGDLSYLLARVVVDSQSTEREATLEAIQESIRANEKAIADLESERDRLQEMDGSKVGKQDVQTNDDGTKFAMIDGQRYGVHDNKTGDEIGKLTLDTSSQVNTLNKRIDALKDSTRALRELNTSTIEAPPASYEPVFLIVEKAQSIAQYKAFNPAVNPTP